MSNVPHETHRDDAPRSIQFAALCLVGVVFVIGVACGALAVATIS